MVEQRRVTLKDVARAAGVHYSTVSLALAGDPRIPSSTARRVEDAARRLRYRPNRAARALRRVRTDTLAFVFWGNSIQQLPVHFHEYTLAAAQSALEAGYQLLLLCVSQDRTPALPIDALLAETDVDGALFVGDPFDRAGLSRLVRNGFPVVHLGQRELPDVVLPYVGADYRQGGRIATEHLLRLGHRRVAALHIEQVNAPEIPLERVGGYRDAMSAANLQTRVRCCDRSKPGDVQATLTWLREEQVTGVFCGEYSLAPPLLDHARASGVAIPNDLSIVAFDDLLTAPRLNPPLTTVRQPRDLAGRLGLQLVRDLVERKASSDPCARQILLPTELIVRSSTAPPNNVNTGGT